MTLTIPQTAALAINSFDAKVITRREAQAMMVAATENLLLAVLRQSRRLTVGDLENLHNCYGLSFEFCGGQLQGVHFDGA